MSEYNSVQRKMTISNLEEMKKDYIRQAHKSRMSEALGFFDKYTNKDLLVLDVGCRNGDYITVMKSRGYLHCRGIDISEEAINEARKQGHDCLVGDAHTIKFNKEFGTVLLSHVLEHTYKPYAVLESISKSLVTDGRLLIEIPLEPEPKEIPTPWAHYYTFQSEQDLFDLVKQVEGLELVSYIKDTKKNKWVRAVYRRVE